MLIIMRKASIFR